MAEQLISQTPAWTPESLRSALPFLSRSDKFKLAELLDLLTEKARREAGQQIRDYRPYAKQALFHALGAHYRERGLLAANQVGKTYSAGCEVAYHVTGKYPDWWEGYRIDKPSVWLCGSKSMELGRDGQQRILLGRDGERGTGTIERDSISKISKYPNVDGAVSKALVRHASGGMSRILFKSYDQGREKWQADTVDGVWMDEEPPEDVYAEALTRTNVTKGPVMVTLTPLLGMTEVVASFLSPEAEASANKTVVNMTLDDAEHFTPEERDALIAQYPAHQRDARTKGLPMLGEGQVYGVEESLITCEPFAIPQHFRRIAGIDFGAGHPTAIVWLAWDSEQDIVYAYDSYKTSGDHTMLPLHAAALNDRGKWIPVAWPHDGDNETAIGPALKKQYEGQGCNFLAKRAETKGLDGKFHNKVEPSTRSIYTRMLAGKFKVFSNRTDLLQEIRMYHRKDGKIVKKGDDLVDAMRYAHMMLRKAKDYPIGIEQGWTTPPTLPRDQLTGI